MRLVIEDEAGTRSTVPFASEEILVGRAEGVTFRVTDRNVSRRHARFVLSSGAVFVEDLGSLTGTRVNGERVTGRRKLRDGDLVQIGDYDLAVVSDTAALSAAGDDAPPPLPPRPAPEPVGAPPIAAAPPPAPAPAPVSDRVAVAAPSGFPAPAPAPRRRKSVLARVLVAAILALALGAAAGFAIGKLTAPHAAGALRSER